VTLWEQKKPSCCRVFVRRFNGVLVDRRRTAEMLAFDHRPKRLTR